MMHSRMHTRTAVEGLLAVGLGLAGFLLANTALGDDDVAYRYGLVVGIGGGMAGVAHPGPLPGFIGFTDLGAEIKGEVRPWGGFLRADFLSSGNDGRWTAWSFSTGVERRLFGGVHRAALFLRGGVAYERWLGNDNLKGCPVNFFVPTSCNLLGAPAATFTATTDMLGLVGGARLELPIRSSYLAFAGNVVPTVGIDGSSPAATLQLRFTVDLGFRDTRSDASVDVPRTQYDLRGRTAPASTTLGK